MRNKNDKSKIADKNFSKEGIEAVKKNLRVQRSHGGFNFFEPILPQFLAVSNVYFKATANTIRKIKPAVRQFWSFRKRFMLTL